MIDHREFGAGRMGWFGAAREVKLYMTVSSFRTSVYYKYSHFRFP